MQWRNTTSSYGAVAKFLHWGIVILIICAVLHGGGRRGTAGRPRQARHDHAPQVARHARALPRARPHRLEIRSTAACRRPCPCRRAQRIAAAAGHGLLYLLLLAQPISGWMMSSAAGYPVSFFGLFDFPGAGRRGPRRPRVATRRCTRCCSPCWRRSPWCTRSPRSTTTSGARTTRCGECCRSRGRVRRSAARGVGRQVRERLPSALTIQIASAESRTPGTIS